MKGYQAKCPSLVDSSRLSDSCRREKIVCGYDGYEILATGIFTKESGLDPLAMKVKCRRCGGEYYLFPQVNFKEEVKE